MSSEPSEKFRKYLTNRRATWKLGDMKPLCELMSEWRETVKVTASEAARRCDMTPQQWYDLETGRSRDPRGSTLLKLHYGTGIDLERLAEAAAFDPALSLV